MTIFFLVCNMMLTSSPYQDDQYIKATIVFYFLRKSSLSSFTRNYCTKNSLKLSVLKLVKQTLFFFCYSPIFLAICKSRNGGSGWNNVGIPGIRVRMRGFRGVGGGMRGIRTGMRGIRVIRVEMSEDNEGKGLGMCESE